MLSIAIGSRLGVRVCTLGSLVAAAMIAAATPGGAAPQLNPDVGGAWSDPHDWTGQIGTTMCDPPPDEKEFSHAALLPKGPHAGKVLIWRKQMVMTGMDCDQTVNTTKVFLVDPNDPDTLITINQQLDSSIFCSGTSWQPNGNLLVVGGIPAFGAPGDQLPQETYRFRPGALSAVINPNNTIDSTPFTQIEDMRRARYYPTVLALNGTPLSMPDTGGTVDGGSSLVIGGPPTVSPDGTRLWELNNPSDVRWSPPIAPLGENVQSPVERYSIRPNISSADADLDSYPRAWQLRNGQVFIGGDVNTVEGSTQQPPNTGTPYSNPPGAAWVIEHPDVFPSNPPEFEWELWLAPPSRDRYYGTAAFFHFRAPGLSNRAVVFGGSEEQLPGGGWEVLDSVQEFEPGSNARDLNSAQWHTKATPMLAKRLFPNAVILPNGQVLLVGGTRTDYVVGHETGATIDPVFAPEIYDIGSQPDSDGSTAWMNMNKEVFIDPGNPGLGIARTPRVYHSTAILLPDARVFVIGGEDDQFPANTYPSPLFSGEIFSPPYLFQPEFAGARPNIFNAPPAVQFNVVNTVSRIFEIDVTMTDEANSIDRVVLLRPAAVTHHFDYDQRYIELKINNFVYNQWNPTDVEIHIESPQEDLGPAGYYMLFALEKENGKRVPSEAVFIKLNPAI